jgi:hypothetical protein
MAAIFVVRFDAIPTEPQAAAQGIIGYLKLTLMNQLYALDAFAMERQTSTTVAVDHPAAPDAVRRPVPATRMTSP